MTELATDLARRTPARHALPPRTSDCPPEEAEAATGKAIAPMALVTVGEQRSPDQLRRLRREGIPLGKALPWGSNEACRVLVERSPSMILLDCSLEGERLADCVRASALIAPVVVLREEGPRMVVSVQGADVMLKCSSGQNILAAFHAGAFDVLDSRAPLVELAARLMADLKRCMQAAQYRRPLWSGGSSPSQRLLFDVIVRATAPICCHDLTQLLGTAWEPLSIRALRARVHRLLPIFDAMGLPLVIDQWRGVFTYRVDRWPAG
ncbi:hypothetical protein [Kitasatospora indigofera]|uniref:hypothetical protein n=1 Tax=Kitasatospora indigofera TaxID=67307 RepID=UPI00368F3B0D